MKTHPPTPEIALAFGAPADAPLPVPGGQGATFRVGDIALKKCDDPAQTEWLSFVLENIVEQSFRIARPICATSGRFVIDGWSASRWIEGTTEIQGRWHQAIEALDAFHSALKTVPCSAVLHRQDNPYVRADAAIWSESPADFHIGPTADRLRRLLRPIDLPSQLIQGDPSEGNLLFAPGVPPAIIDIAPYWHPADYAIAMLIADGIAWSHAPHNLLDLIAPRPEIHQLLLRAVLFRLYVGHLFRGGESAAERRAAAYAPVIHSLETHLTPASP